MRAGLLMGRATQRVAARPRCPAVEEQAEGLVPSLQAAALLVDPPWVVANGIWGERWRGDWKLVLLDVGHTEEVLVVLVLAEVPMVLVLVLLVCR